MLASGFPAGQEAAKRPNDDQEKRQVMVRYVVTNRIATLRRVQEGSGASHGCASSPLEFPEMGNSYGNWHQTKITEISTMRL